LNFNLTFRSLNISSKAFALVGAALLLLDFASTSVTSAATAASYLAGEIALPFPAYVGAFCVLVAFTAVNLSGIRESARVALVVLSFHVKYFAIVNESSDGANHLQIATMMMLAIASIIAWTRIGNQQLMENWNTGHTPSAHEVARQIFIGFCIAMLGLTGFECEWFSTSSQPRYS
jgi:amino acid transporter